MPFRLFRPAAALGALALPILASAHDADLIAVAVSAPRPSVEERVKMTGGTLSLLVPLDRDGDGLLTGEELAAGTAALEAGFWDFAPLTAGGAPCERRSTSAALGEGTVELRATFLCPPGELSQRFRVLSVLPSGYKVVVSRPDGPAAQRFAQGTEETVIIPGPSSGPGDPGAPERVEGLGGWLGLGVLHIFTGYDHVAFLVALLLVGKTWRRVLAMVTSFTLAHSVTLGLAALDVVPLGAWGARLVEVAIAASVIYVAAENLFLEEHRHRVLITFAFGLVHGFGFASVLRSYGLDDAVVTGLLGFNLGVEVGQACLVVALFPLVQLLSRRPAAFLWITRAVSVVIAATGGYWLVDRLLALR